MNDKKVYIIAGIALFVIFITAVVVKDCSYKQGFEYAAQQFYTNNVQNKIKTKSPGQFNPKIDYARMINSVANIKDGSNPNNYKEFSISLRNIHEEVLSFLSEVIELPEVEKKQLLAQYKNSHEKIAREYYSQLVEKHKNDVPNSDKTVVNWDIYKSVDDFSRLLSANVCSLAGFVVTVASKSPALGKPVGLFLGKPCQFLLSKALKPINAELRQWALVEDYKKSEARLRDHISNMIAELATVEDKFETTLDETYVREILKIFKSKAKLRLKAVGNVKAGIDMKKFFSLEFKVDLHEIIITLPEPEILTNEIVPKIENIEDGWFIEIDKEKINEALVNAKKILKAEALKSKILDRAKKNAGAILKVIFQPIVMAADPPLKITICFGLPKKEKTPVLLNNKDQIEKGIEGG